MEIIDKVSRTLGLADKEDEAAPASKPEESPTEQPEQTEPPIQPPPAKQGHNVVDFNSAMAARDNLMTNNNIPTKPMVKTKITTVRPKTFDEDAKIIADCLREDIPVIVNLEETAPSTSRSARLMPLTAMSSRSARQSLFAHPKPSWSPSTRKKSSRKKISRGSRGNFRD